MLEMNIRLISASLSVQEMPDYSSRWAARR